METLYDLLGALPGDDAEGLRTAFRKAVKGAHPDINPGDPDAAHKFRQIVRANEILSDEEQRAAYNHLLALAELEQKSASRQAIAATIQKLASGAMALVGISAVSVGGYLLLMHMSAASVAPPNEATPEQPEIAAVTSAPKQDTNGQDAPPAKPESGSVAAIADLGPAIQLDPKPSAADVAPAKRAEKTGRTGRAPTIARTHRSEPRATPASPRPTARRDPWHEPAFPFARLR